MNGVQATGLENPWWVLGMVAIALIVLAWKTLSTNNEIRHQVKNDHKTNLREDIDTVSHKLDRVLTAQGKTAEDMVILKRQVYALQIKEDSFEDTQQRDEENLRRAVQERNAAIAQLRRDVPRLVEEYCKGKCER